MLGETGETDDLTMRLDSLERTSLRIEEMLESLRDEIASKAESVDTI